MTAFRAVQYDGHVLETLFVVHPLQFGQHAAFQQSGAHHEKGAVGLLFDDLRVGHDVDGRTVDKDIIILSAQFLNECFEAGFCQQLCRVGRNGAGGQQVQVRVIRIILNQVVQAVFPFAEVIAQPFCVPVHIGGCRTVPHVAIYDQHPFAFQRKGRRRVDGQEGLSASRIERSKEEHARPVVLTGIQDKLHVGAQHAECFVHHVATARLDDNAFVFCGSFLLGIA